MENFDLGIIGGGPAGYTAAIHAANSGNKVVLFEKEHIGGVCLNKGCIPTKSILHASEVYSNIKNCESCGISVNEVTLDYSKVLERKNQTVQKLRKGIELALKNSKVTVVNDEANINSANEIQTKSGENYHCKEIICAVGSSPRELKGLEFDHKF